MKKMATFQVEESLLETLNFIAQKHERSVSAQIRLILKEYIDKYTNEKG